MIYADVHEKVGILGENESVLGYFECYIDKMRGFVVPTNKRLMFIQSGERRDKSFRIILETEYDKIEEIDWNANNYILIKLNNSKYKRKIEPIDTSLQLLEKILRSCIKKEPSLSDYCVSDHPVIVEDS